jgi:hypothetical protein
VAVQSTSFIVRVHRHVGGRLSGVVERVRDGVRTPLPSELTGLGDVIARMLPPARCGASVPDPTLGEEAGES